MKSTIFISVLIAFISGCNGYNKWTFEVDDHLTVAYISNHNYFSYYNSNLTLSYMYLHDSQTGIYCNASTGNILLVRSVYGYFLKGKLSLSFDSNKNLYNSFDQLYNMSSYFLNSVHGGSALTSNGFDIRLFKRELLKEELQLTTFDPFLENADVAVLLNENFGDFIEELSSNLRSQNGLLLNGYEFVASGMQLYNHDSAVAVFFGAQHLRNINPDISIIKKFHNYLHEGNYKLILKLAQLLIAGKLFYEDEAQALAAEETFKVNYMFNEINSQKQLYYYCNDSESQDWYIHFIGGLAPTLIYYSTLNVFIIWKYMNDCFALFDGNSNNYALYDEWRGAAIVVDKSESNALITVKNADKIAYYYKQSNYRKAFEEAAKVVNQINVTSDGEGTFIFDDFVKSAYELGSDYTYPNEENITQQINKFYHGFTQNFKNIRGYDDRFRGANAILNEFITIELNDLPTELVELIYKIGTNASPDFNKDTLKKVYNDIIDNAKNSFKGDMFINLGI